MKILLFTDNHYCTTSSIIRGRGNRYSTRIENQIKSLNWVEEIAEKYSCDRIVCLGDFFDKSILTDEEITSFKEIKWSNIEHYFIVGNHESSINNLTYNSTKALQNDKFKIVDRPIVECIFGSRILYLPYIIESDREDLSFYLSNKEHSVTTQEVKNLIVLSHNDIKGIQMGKIISTTGFDIDEIEHRCDLFINGHIHNGSKFCRNGINLGNLTGQNFSEDSFKYSHNVMILDTLTLKYELIENPYAFNFYKIEINNIDDLKILDTLKNNIVICVSVVDRLVYFVEKYLEDLKESKKLIEYKLIIKKELNESTKTDDSGELRLNHIDELIKFCKIKLEDTKILNEELEEICK